MLSVGVVHGGHGEGLSVETSLVSCVVRVRVSGTLTLQFMCNQSERCVLTLVAHVLRGCFHEHNRKVLDWFPCSHQSGNSSEHWDH